MFSGSFKIYFFLLLGLVANLVLAANTPDLGIKRDESLAKNNFNSYGSVCTFKDAPSDPQFLNMIELAFNDMKTLSDAELSKKAAPNAMIGLAIGNQVYFASSIKSVEGRPIIYELKGDKKSGGKGAFNQLPEMPEQYQRITQALEDCSKEANSDPQHKMNGMCGEFTSTLAWMIDNPDKDISNEKTRVAAWGPKGYLPPCTGPADNENVWGCSRWTKKMGYQVIENNDKRDSNDIPKPTGTKNVDLEKCTKVQPKNTGEKGKDKRGVKLDEGRS